MRQQQQVKLTLQMPHDSRRASYRSGRSLLSSVLPEPVEVRLYDLWLQRLGDVAEHFPQHLLSLGDRFHLPKHSNQVYQKFPETASLSNAKLYLGYHPYRR